MPIAPFGVYSATKHAIEAYTTVLRKETKQFGVHVCSVQPAGFKTGEYIKKTQYSI